MVLKQIDNPEISSNFQGRMANNARDKAEFATTADRIIGLLKDEPIEVELTDDVTLAFYPPSDDEYIEIIRFRADGMGIAAKAKQFGINPESEDEAIERIPEAVEIITNAQYMLNLLNNILERLSVDKSFTSDVFRQMPQKYKQKILSEISASYVGDINKVKKFRPKSKR